MAGDTSDKSRSVALVLGLLLGWAGGHRWYVGKTGTAILMLCTAGGLGVWWLYDVITLAAGGFRDAEGRLLTEWGPEIAARFGPDAVPERVLDELDALRAQVAALEERVEFTERLLSSRSSGSGGG